MLVPPPPKRKSKMEKRVMLSDPRRRLMSISPAGDETETFGQGTFS